MPHDLPCPESRIYRHRNKALLAGLAAFVLLSPFFEASGSVGDVILAIMASLLIGTCVLAVPGAVHKRRAALVLAGFALIAHVASASLPGQPALVIVADFLTAALLVCVAYLVLFRLFQATGIGVEQVCAGVAVYLLLALVFARLYHCLQVASPGAFVDQLDRQIPSYHDFIYFSFVTLTTLGYGDLVPALPAAKSLAMLEALCGVFYLAILISRLTTLYQPARLEETIEHAVEEALEHHDHEHHLPPSGR
ncbi:MAG: two pore domain potassium channel family protein [Verrucomicrobiales bacterium]|nr:two pore domain potassium channel family protein [Verrucomicrobiales bacterium]